MRSARGQWGQAVVELALILPALAAILLGAVDFGRGMAAYIALANAAREGARYCALHPGDTAGTRSRVAAEIGGRVAVDTSAVTCPAAGTGQAVTVTATATLSLVTPFMNRLAGGALRLRVPATMVVW